MLELQYNKLNKFTGKQNAEWTMNEYHWSIRSGRWIMDDGRLAMDQGQYKTESRHWEVVNGQWPIFLFILCFFLLTAFPSKAQMPPGFGYVHVSTSWNELEGFAWDGNGQQYCWEKGGKVWIVDTTDAILPVPLIDISEEVGNWRDHGLNGFALHPNFLSNGYFYLFYTVDRHYLMNFGTPNYNPAVNEYYDATIVRVTRYQADAATNFTTVVPGSRNILIGSTKQNGIPLLFESHSGGALVFGTDTTLLVSTGDGGSAQFADGGNGYTYWAQALLDTIILPKENVGCFRAQMLNCLNGKILRIDPMTGEGVSSNPFYDPAYPNSAKSKVWASGFRNPFRMCLRPGTGNTDATAGDPGVLYLGDVGWDTWEESDVIKGPGGNYGWPLFEGLTVQPSFDTLITYNEDAPNPLYGTGGCTQQYFSFQDLLHQATLNPAATFTNPCDSTQQIPSTIPTFFHTRPDFDWNHWQPITRTGIFTGNNADEILINDLLSPVPGPVWQGNCAIAGCWYTGTNYPPEYQNCYYQGDFAVAILKRFFYNANNTCDSIADFMTQTGSFTFVAEHPKEHVLYYVFYPATINKLFYTTAINNPPVAVASADTIYGASPFTVNFTGTNSTDPENQPLVYQWDFGDANTSNNSNPQHTFYAPAGVPTTYHVFLTVTDTGGLTSMDSLIICVNNTPPVAQITSFNDGDLFSMSHNSYLPLEALVTDAEHGPSQLFYTWRVYLHHNNHEHPEAPDTNRITNTVISPVGCNGNVYYYRIELTVIDAGGLSTVVNASVYPACNVPVAAFASGNPAIIPGGYVNFTDQSANLPDSIWWSFPGGNPSTATGITPSVQYNSTGYYDVQLIAKSIMGSDTLLQNNYVFVDLANEIEAHSFIEYVSIAPNPADEKVELNLKTKQPTSLTVKILNAQGQIILSKKYPVGDTFNKIIDLKNYSNGMYLIQLITDSEVVFRKMLKE
ncbi:MAG: PKD domain-containing protein [Bacteroidia bacterium]